MHENLPTSKANQTGLSHNPKPKVSISRLKFSGGNTFDLKPNEKILLVGPNNAGKSQALREIVAICRGGRNERPTVIAELKLEKNGDKESLRNFLEKNATYVHGNYRHKNWQLPADQISFWDQEYLLHALSAGFIKTIAANDRLAICDQQASISPQDQKSKPQHVLYDDENLMSKISALFKNAFGQDIMFDFRGGSKIPIHVGSHPKLGGNVDRVSDAYVRAVRENPLLDKQGDGVKSYAGILFEAIVSNLDITLIDEPEAFLHPPQMRKLGETLASEVSGQLIVATHSSDILRGFLEGTHGNVRILRIRQEAGKNFVAEASPDVIKELWEKPELRYSNALEGIFHEQTIICEDDSDCRLLNSVADHISSSSKEQWQDTAYVPTGGKHGAPKVGSVLRQIGVPIKAVFDIDFLAEEEVVRSAVECFGGDWKRIRPVWARVDAAVRSGCKPKSAPEIKQEIIAALDEAGSDKFPAKKELLDIMKQDKPWSVVKRFGAIAIPRGEAQRNYDELRKCLEAVGIYLVPVGEVENFCRDVGSHGPRFVTKVLSTIPLGDERLSDLRSFVRSVHRGIGRTDNPDIKM